MSNKIIAAALLAAALDEPEAASAQSAPAREDSRAVMPTFEVGDVITSEYGYDLIVCVDAQGVQYGKLVCEPGDSCENIPHSLHGVFTVKTKYNATNESIGDDPKFSFYLDNVIATALDSHTRADDLAEDRLHQSACTALAKYIDARRAPAGTTIATALDTACSGTGCLDLSCLACGGSGTPETTATNDMPALPDMIGRIEAIIDSCTLFRLSAEAKAVGSLLEQMREYGKGKTGASARRRQKAQAARTDRNATGSDHG